MSHPLPERAELGVSAPFPGSVVYLVDDHAIELELMRRWCERGGLTTQTFERPDSFLGAVDATSRGCVVADLRMPQRTGLELQAELFDRGILLPVILVTGQGDTENCRAAFQQGAFDFIEKGFDTGRFLDVVRRACQKNDVDFARRRARDEALSLLASISPRENTVMMMLAGGAALKHIAHDLGISVQTASKHRTSIFTKLALTNEVDLFKLLLAAGLALPSDPSSPPKREDDLGD